MTEEIDIEAEFSRLISPSELGGGKLTLDIEADEAERHALAKRLGLVDLPALHATLEAKWVRGGRYLRLAGRLHAELVQTCVVTLEPVAGEIEANFKNLYYSDADEADRDGEPPDEEAECLTGDSLDVGEAVAVELALAMEPYPRKPGVSLEIGPKTPENRGFSMQEEATERTFSKPFEGLAALRGNK